MITNNNNVSLTEAASLLGITRKTLYKWIDAEIIEKITVGMKPYIRVTEVNRVLKNLKK
jgi:excisionase family DNA binding protein